MRFEDVLPLMRGGMIGIDRDGTEWMTSGNDFFKYGSTGCETNLSTSIILGEWNVKEGPKLYQWIWRYKGEVLWSLATSDRPFEECIPVNNVEARKIEP